MKKYFLFVVLAAIMPNLCFGASARYTQLVREKQRKMEELEKCMGSSKGLKIAGISTLGLSAVGVAGNIYEANEIKKYDSYIASKDKAIEKTQKEIDEKKAELAKKDAEKAEGAANASEETQQAATQQEADFQTLCSELGGTYNIDQIPKYKGNAIEVNIPVSAACVLSGTNNTEEKCKELVAKCEPGKNHRHYNSDTGLCACLGDIDAKCLNGESECRDSDSNKVVSKSQNVLTNEKSEVSTGEDCTVEAKENSLLVVSAVKKGDKCEVQQCEEGFKPSADGLECEPQDDEEETADDVLVAATDNQETTEHVQNQTKAGDDCPDDQLPVHATKGHFINVGGGQIKCAATECEDKYEVAKNAAGQSQGWCKIKETKSVVKTESKSVAQVATEQPKQNPLDLGGKDIYLKKEFSTYTVTIDGKKYVGTTSGVSASPTTRDMAALKNLKEQLDAAGYTNYHLVDESVEKVQKKKIYYTKDLSTYKATVDGVTYTGRSGGVSFSPASRDAASLKILKEKLDAAGYKDYELVEQK